MGKRYGNIHDFITIVNVVVGLSLLVAAGGLISWITSQDRATTAVAIVCLAGGLVDAVIFAAIAAGLTLLKDIAVNSFGREGREGAKGEEEHPQITQISKGPGAGASGSDSSSGPSASPCATLRSTSLRSTSVAKEGFAEQGRSQTPETRLLARIVDCPKCGTILKLPANWPHPFGRCPACKKTFHLPT